MVGTKPENCGCQIKKQQRQKRYTAEMGQDVAMYTMKTENRIQQGGESKYHRYHFQRPQSQLIQASF